MMTNIRVMLTSGNHAVKTLFSSINQASGSTHYYQEKRLKR